MSTYNDIEVGKVISTLKVIIDRVYVIGDGEERKVNVFLKGEDFEYATGQWGEFIRNLKVES